MMKNVVWLVAAFLIVLSVSIQGQLIYIPSNDRINKEIEELQAKGYLKGLSQTEKPWMISTVASAIINDEDKFDPSSRKLAAGILDYLEPSQRDESNLLSAAGVLGLNLRGLSREKREGYYYYDEVLVSRGFKNEFGSIYRGRAWISRESRWGIDSELIFDSDGTGYPWYYGTAHNAKIVGQFDHAYINFAFDRFGLFLGRQRFIWGPSPRGSLLLDDSSPPMDMLAYSFELRPFALSGFSARLDDYIEPSTNIANRRFISGHRLRLNPGKGLELAFTEIYVYGGPDRLPELYYNIPIVLYYWEAQNRKQDDNAFWGLDVSWIKDGLGRFYAQFNFDDIQRQHRAPQKIAEQFGAYLAPKVLSGWSGIFELNIVDTYVYGQRKRLNAYLNWGWPLARLDSDQREYFAGVYRRFGNTKLGMEFVGRDKGEYDAAEMQPNMAPFGMKFPSGIVEKTKNLAFTASLNKSSSFDCRLSIGYETVRNYQHIDKVTLNQIFATLQVSYSLKMGLPFWKEFR